MEVVVSKFVLSKVCFFFCTKWNKESFGIQVTDGKYAWRSEVSKDLIEQELKPKEMDLSHYLELVKSALTSQDKEGKMFTYSMGKKKNDLKFVWKIKIANDLLEYWV